MKFFCKQSKAISHYSNFLIFVLDLRMHFQKISLALHDVCGVHKWTIVDCQCIRYRSLSHTLSLSPTHTHTLSPISFLSHPEFLLAVVMHFLRCFHFTSLSRLKAARVWKVIALKGSIHFYHPDKFFSVRKIEFHCHVLNCCTSQHWFLAKAYLIIWCWCTL